MKMVDKVINFFYKVWIMIYVGDMIRKKILKFWNHVIWMK